MIFVGVDVGQKGCFSAIDFDGNVLGLADNHKYQNVVKFLESLPDEEIIICIEDVHSVQGSSSKATFSFGMSKGKAEAISGYFLTMRNQSMDNITFVLPQTWKKFYGLITDSNTPTEEKKRLSIKKCYELFPGVDLYTSSRAKTPSDDRAESLLIANYIRVKYCPF